jgi:hypothetical protein
VTEPKPAPLERIAAPVRPLASRAQAFYAQHEQLFLGGFFLGGVGWDALTLRRVDELGTNLLLLAYLLLLGGLITLALVVETGRWWHPRLAKARPWFPAAIQFLMGALFSAYIVFYFQSASSWETVVFLLILAALLVANEVIHKRLLHAPVLVGLYFFCAFSFLVFFVPILVKAMSQGVFVASGLLAVAFVGGWIWALHRLGVLATRDQAGLAAGIVLVMFCSLNVLYALNLMPPVPLALRHAGVYHEAERTRSPEGRDAFRLVYEDAAWWRFGRETARVVHREPGQPVHVFTAIFAPTDLKKRITHEWARWNEASEAWEVSDRLEWRRPLVGGREGGYRGFTFKRNTQPGRWRVEVRTADGRILGRLHFEIADGEPGELETRYY